MSLKKKKFKIAKNRGITLVALVVTIVILIILATVSISVTFGENGLIAKAKQAKQDTESAVEREQEQLAQLEQEYANIINESKVPEPPKDISELISINPNMVRSSPSAEDGYMLGETVLFSIILTNNSNTNIENINIKLEWTNPSGKASIIEENTIALKAGETKEITPEGHSIEESDFGGECMAKLTLTCEYGSLEQTATIKTPNN